MTNSEHELEFTFAKNCNRWYCVHVYELLRRLFHVGNFCFWVPFFKQLLLKNYAVDFVEIYNICTRKVIIKAAKRIFNSDKICRSYCDFYFGVTFFGTQCIYLYRWSCLTSVPSTWLTTTNWWISSICFTLSLWVRLVHSSSHTCCVVFATFSAW